jgi:exodeoxyribonuclease V gamma subunit
MLHVFRSNRLEHLLARQAEVIADPVGSVFDPEIILVPHPGIRRWLEIRLAEKLGVVANIEFPFPAAYIWTLLGAQMEAVPDRDMMDRPLLHWRIYEQMQKLGSGQNEYPELSSYLAGAEDGLKGWKLAGRLAEAYDRYLVYRPDWIRDWDRGDKKDVWQARLWRAISGHGYANRVRLLDDFAKLYQADQCRLDRLPARISVFAVNSLPPSMIELFSALAEFTEIYLFVHSPCEEYWGDILSERARTRLIARRLVAEEAGDLLEVGNALLASMGKEGQDLIKLLFDAADFEDLPDYLEPLSDQPTLLQHIQSDILHLSQGEKGVVAIPADDESIQLHVCHSPMRECEVVHDQLLDLFERIPGLSPRDVVIMAPDINTYAPAIQAVFTTRDKKQHIPWSLVDQDPGEGAPLIRWVLSFLRLPDMRMSVTEVMDLLDARAVMRRLRLETEDIDTIRGWIEEGHVHWGLDGPDRAEQGVPETHQNTWAFGKERLLAGYALPEQEHQVFDNIAPTLGDEGGRADLMGRFFLFIDRLRELRQAMSTARSSVEWQLLLEQVFEQLLTPDEEEQQLLQDLRDAMDRINEDAQLAGAEMELDRATWRDILSAYLQQGTSPGYLAGAVTCCALQPMRSIPFRVVCLLGMNEADFPRKVQRAGFDLMAHDHRAGDRDHRADDRYLFLETINSARDVLHISYVGKDIRDDSERQPSTLVSELLDYCDAWYQPASNEISRLRDQLIIEHPLQPFSPAYFDQAMDDGLYSFSTFWSQTAAGLSGSRSPRAPFHQEGQQLDLDEQEATLELDTLQGFFQNPGRAFFRHGLGMGFGIEEAVLEDDEPFELNKLEQYVLRDRLIEARLTEQDEERLTEYVQREGVLPHGAGSAAAIDDARAQINSLWRRMEPELGEGETLVEIRLQLDRIELVGQLPVRQPNGRRLLFRPGNLRGKNVLRLWIDHLALCASDQAASDSSFVARDRIIRFKPVPTGEALRLLNELVALYLQGICEPLPLFPCDAWERVVQKQSDAKIKMTCKFEADDYVQRIYGPDADPWLSESASQVGRQVFEPIASYTFDTEGGAS